MTVSTTTDAPVELKVDLLVLLFTMAPPAPLVETLSDTLGAAAADVALDHEAETVGCLLPVEEGLEDVRTAQGLVEGFVLGAYRDRRYETADGFDGPSAFCMHVATTTIAPLWTTEPLKDGTSPPRPARPATSSTGAVSIPRCSRSSRGRRRRPSMIDPSCGPEKGGCSTRAASP